MNLKIIALPLVLVFSCNQYFPRKMLGDDPLEHRRNYAHACDIIPRLNRYI